MAILFEVYDAKIIKDKIMTIKDLKFIFFDKINLSDLFKLSKRIINIKMTKPTTEAP